MPGVGITEWLLIPGRRLLRTSFPARRQWQPPLPPAMHRHSNTPRGGGGHSTAHPRSGDGGCLDLMTPCQHLLFLLNPKLRRWGQCQRRMGLRVVHIHGHIPPAVSGSPHWGKRWPKVAARRHYCGPQSFPCPPLCDIPSGCCSFTGPWTVTRSSLRMLRRVAAFCRPLRPVLLPV